MKNQSSPSVGWVLVITSLQAWQHLDLLSHLSGPKCVSFHISFLEEIVLRASDGPQLPPRVLAQEVICLDSSSGSEDEKSSRDGKIRPEGHLVHFLLANVHLYVFFFLVCVGV